MLSFIFIYSLFLSIPLPYLSQPPLGSCPISRDRPAHQTRGLGDVPTPGDVSASPALTRPLDTLLFPFSLPWKGFPPSHSPFPFYGRGGRGDRCRFLATQGAPRSRSHGHLLIPPRWVPAGDPAVPAALGHLRGWGSLGFQQGAGNGKSASRGLFPGREQAGWVGGVPGGISGEEGSWQGGEGVPAGRQGPGKPSPQPGSGAGFRKCFARR